MIILLLKNLSNTLYLNCVYLINMDTKGLTEIGQFIKFKYNIFIDLDKLCELNKKIDQSSGGKEKYDNINMFCEAIFGIDFATLQKLIKHDDWINFQEKNCIIRQHLQKTLSKLETETQKKISELEQEIELLKMTNEELRTNYWNLKHET